VIYTPNTNFIAAPAVTETAVNSPDAIPSPITAETAHTSGSTKIENSNARVLEIPQVLDYGLNDNAKSTASPSIAASESDYSATAPIQIFEGSRIVESPLESVEQKPRSSTRSSLVSGSPAKSNPVTGKRSNYWPNGFMLLLQIAALYGLRKLKRSNN
jgi:hypothetical protein